MKKCQCCQKFEKQVILKDDVEYHLCHNCLFSLVTMSLNSEQYLNLVKIHGDTAFLLHCDFYDEEGNALQSVFG